MRFFPPEGTSLVAELAAGTVFHVAVVRARSETVVCKRLTPRVREEPAARIAIVREAMLLSRVHCHALPLFRRVGTDSHGPFVLEELIEGVSFRDLVEGWSSRRRPVPPRLVGHLAVTATESLSAFHALCTAKGPLTPCHGDVAPSHLIVSPLGDVRFVDFGAARFDGMPEDLVTSDRGTLPFVAPEVARGETAPTPAADVYALAATILYLALSAPLSQTLDEAAMLLAIGERGLAIPRVDPIPGLSTTASDALRRALVFDPASRLSSAAVLAQGLSQ
jgi:serine/threonine-protein kinase